MPGSLGLAESSNQHVGNCSMTSVGVYIGSCRLIVTLALRFPHLLTFLPEQSVFQILACEVGVGIETSWENSPAKQGCVWPAASFVLQLT